MRFIIVRYWMGSDRSRPKLDPDLVQHLRGWGCGPAIAPGRVHAGGLEEDEEHQHGDHEQDQRGPQRPAAPRKVSMAVPP